MGLSQFKQQDQFDHTLKAPNGDETDIVFTLAGPTHPARAALERRNQARGLREYNSKGKATLPVDPDDLKQAMIERLLVCVLGWKNLVVEDLFGDKPVEFNADAAKKLFENDHYGWVRDQLGSALNDVELFTRGSSKTSSSSPSTSSR